LVFLLPKIFELFGFECIWWKLFPKQVVRTKFDIYVIITITGSIPLLVDYHWVDTSAGGLSLGRYLCWWTIIGSIPLLVDYHWVDTSAGGLSLGRYLCWWTIIGSIPLLVDYHWVDTSAGGLSLGRYLCWWTIIGSIPLLVDYQSPRVSFA
jgi:hypothetical protein